MSMLPLSQTQAKRLGGLRARRRREQAGLFLAEGIRVVEDLLASPLVIESVVTAPSLEDTARGRELWRRLQQAPAGTLFRTTDAGLRLLADTDAPQGIVAVARMPGNRLPADLPAGSLVVVLDGVQDPGNFGTLVRGADAFAAAALVALPGTVDFWNGKAVRAAAGSSFRVPLARATVEEFAAWAAGLGVTIWGTSADGVDVAARARPERLALVLGNEGAGLSPAVRALAAEHVALPIRGAADSLNVAMAGTVLMYLLTL